MGDDEDYTISISDSPTIVFDNMNTITLGSSDSVDTFSIDSILKSARPYKSDPSETIISYKVSPLAVVLQLLDNGVETWQVVERMLGQSVNELNISEANTLLADEIKEHYRAKIINDTLSSKGRRSDYRSDLIMALALLDMYQTKRSFIPMLIKLPEFYKEDIKLENIAASYTSVPNVEVNDGKVSELLDVELKLVDQVRVNRRNLKGHSLYFADSNNKLYVLNTDLKNSLLPFISMLESKTIKLRCRVKPVHQRFHEFNFYSILDKYEVLEIT